MTKNDAVERADPMQKAIEMLDLSERCFLSDRAYATAKLCKEAKDGLQALQTSRPTMHPPCKTCGWSTAHDRECPDRFIKIVPYGGDGDGDCNGSLQTSRPEPIPENHPKNALGEPSPIGLKLGASQAAAKDLDGFFKAVKSYGEGQTSRPDAGWKSLDSAPKDFTSVLLWLPEYSEPHPDDMGEWHEERVVIGWFSPAEYDGDNTWHWDLSPRGLHRQQPTHWQPLPAPPTSEGV